MINFSLNTCWRLIPTIRKCEKECNRTPFSVVCPLTTT